MAKSGSIRNFHAHFQNLGFREPRWQKVHASLFNPARWARYRMKEFQTLLSNFKKSK